MIIIRKRICTGFTFLYKDILKNPEINNYGDFDMRQVIGLNFVSLRRNTTEIRPLNESLKLCKDAGILLLDHLTPVTNEDYLENAHKQREAIEEAGLQIHQSHCPFFRYGPNGLEKFREFAPRAVKTAAVLGAKYLVFHADEARPENGEPFDAERILARTREYLAPIIDQCVELGIRPAIENLFEEDPANRSRFTHAAEEVIAVIESFPGSGIGCCLDTGHLNVSTGGGDAFITDMEKLAPYVVCTHIHDNRYGRDMHKPAFFGDIPWEKLMAILKKNNYAGELCWEFVYERVPDEVYPAFMNMVRSSGEYLIRQFEAVGEPLKSH